MKQIKHVVVLINDHIFAFCAVQKKRARVLELFKRNAYALPSFSHFSHFFRSICMTDQHVPRLLTSQMNIIVGASLSEYCIANVMAHKGILENAE